MSILSLNYITWSQSWVMSSSRIISGHRQDSGASIPKRPHPLTLWLVLVRSIKIDYLSINYAWNRASTGLTLNCSWFSWVLTTLSCDEEWLVASLPQALRVRDQTPEAEATITSLRRAIFGCCGLDGPMPGPIAVSALLIELLPCWGECLCENLYSHHCSWMMLLISFFISAMLALKET